MSEVVKIHEKPYFSNTLTTKQEYTLSDYKNMVANSYHNLLTIDDSQFQTNDLPNRLDFSLRRKIQSLCRGQVIKKVKRCHKSGIRILCFFFSFLIFFNLRSGFFFRIFPDYLPEFFTESLNPIFFFFFGINILSHLKSCRREKKIF